MEELEMVPTAFKKFILHELKLLPGEMHTNDSHFASNFHNPGPSPVPTLSK